MISREILDKRGTYWENRINLFVTEVVPENPFVFVGDSLVERFPLKKYFDSRFVNRGIGGDHADGLWDRRELMALEKKPIALFLMVGINDLLFNYKRNQIPEYQTKFLAYVREKTPKTKIYLHSICPVKSEATSPKEIKTVNKELNDLAIKVKADYIDLFSLLANPNGEIRPEFTIDGVHLSESAYEIWANEVKRRLKD